MAGHVFGQCQGRQRHGCEIGSCQVQIEHVNVIFVVSIVQPKGLLLCIVQTATGNLSGDGFLIPAGGGALVE
jgi:hypothetical protein